MEAVAEQVSNIRHIEHTPYYERCFIAPAFGFDKGLVDDYWLALEEAGTLQFRLCDINKPHYSDVINMFQNKYLQHYNVYDTIKQQLVGEFMLENFMGRAAQIHFSMHPDNRFTDSINLAIWVGDQILNKWTNTETKKPFLDSIYGLTPATNRVACIFVLKAGFKKIGYLYNSIKDRGKIVEAMIVEKRHGRQG